MSVSMTGVLEALPSPN